MSDIESHISGCAKKTVYHVRIVLAVTCVSVNVAERTLDSAVFAGSCKLHVLARKNRPQWNVECVGLKKQAGGRHDGNSFPD